MHKHKLTWYHTWDLGEEAFDSPDGYTTCFLILYSCDNVFNLLADQREIDFSVNMFYSYTIDIKNGDKKTAVLIVHA